MTDKKVIKALECCGTFEWCGQCSLQGKVGCKDILSENALDLIKSQQAEIERLTINMNAFGLGMKREKERADTIRAEAIKEIAERLQTEIATIIEKLTMTKSQYIKENYKCLSCDFIAMTRGKIEILNRIKDFVDNLVKEVVGEDNAQ